MTFIEHCYSLHELTLNPPHAPVMSLSYYHIFQKEYLRLRGVEHFAAGHTAHTGHSQDVGPGAVPKPIILTATLRPPT